MKSYNEIKNIIDSMLKDCERSEKENRERMAKAKILSYEYDDAKCSMIADMAQYMILLKLRSKLL